MKNLKKISRETLKNIAGGKLNPLAGEAELSGCYDVIYCYSTKDKTIGTNGALVVQTSVGYPQGDNLINVHACGWAAKSNPGAGC